jgi:hypothetical protein
MFKEDLSSDTNFDPGQFLLESIFRSQLISWLELMEPWAAECFMGYTCSYKLILFDI